MTEIEEPAQSIFTRIYEEGLWGRANDTQQVYYSGQGSHDPALVEPYVRAVSLYLHFHTLIIGKKPNIVDLGCGDFNVGARLRPLCHHYIACDVAAPVIQWNRKKYQNLGVDFRQLDILADPLPEGDIVFLRQVLQHLSNAQIAIALQKIAKTYRFLVLTEHLPPGNSFTANLDKRSGSDIRLSAGSGVVVTQPPFSLPVTQAQTICEVAGYGGVLRTDIFRLCPTS